MKNEFANGGIVKADEVVVHHRCDIGAIINVTAPAVNEGVKRVVITVDHDSGAKLSPSMRSAIVKALSKELRRG